MREDRRRRTTMWGGGQRRSCAQHMHSFVWGSRLDRDGRATLGPAKSKQKQPKRKKEREAKGGGHRLLGQAHGKEKEKREMGFRPLLGHAFLFLLLDPKLFSIQSLLDSSVYFFHHFFLGNFSIFFHFFFFFQWKKMNYWHVQEQYNLVSKWSQWYISTYTKITHQLHKIPQICPPIKKCCPTNLGLEVGKCV